MRFPRLHIVRQKFPDRRLPDVAAEVRKQLSTSGFAARLKPGARIAIGVGSRGIHNIATIVRSAVAYWKEQGMQPFLFPAMGSHGAATAAGQAMVLAHYGITEATMGCPVMSQRSEEHTSELQSQSNLVCRLLLEKKKKKEKKIR